MKLSDISQPLLYGRTQIMNGWSARDLEPVTSTGRISAQEWARWKLRRATLVENFFSVGFLINESLSWSLCPLDIDTDTPLVSS